jgi:hypothetical protein
MENNWKETAEVIFKNEFNLGTTPMDGEITLNWEYIWKAVEKCMNLVFEATKKECADKAEVVFIPNLGNIVYIKSILNINKLNL